MKRERGLAAITALLIVAVAAAAATLMLAQQSAMLDQTAMVAARAQADAYGQAGLDWARGVLAADANGTDSLGEGWAQPMAGLPVERAVVSGFIVDEQGKLNLNNLVKDGKKSDPDMAAFQRLLAGLGLAPGLADAVLDWIDLDGDLTVNGGAEDAYYLGLPRPHRAANLPMLQVEELYRVRGFDAKAVARIRPFVTALPRRTAVNANTAPAPVLEAILHDVPRELIAAFAAARVKKPMKTKQEVVDALTPKDAAAAQDALDVKSAFFQASVQVAQDDVLVASDALIERKDGAAPALVWRRPRF